MTCPTKNNACISFLWAVPGTEKWAKEHKWLEDRCEVVQCNPPAFVPWGGVLHNPWREKPPTQSRGERRNQGGGWAEEWDMSSLWPCKPCHCCGLLDVISPRVWGARSFPAHGENQSTLISECTVTHLRMTNIFALRALKQENSYVGSQIWIRHLYWDIYL